MPKIFVAGKFADGAYIAKQYIEYFERYGCKVTMNWTQYGMSPDAPDEKLAVCAADLLAGVKQADYVIVVITDATYAYRGTCTEMGIALALGKPVFIIEEVQNSVFCSNVYTKHPLVQKIKIDDLIAL